MKIVNNYDYHGFLTTSVFWRTFGAWDDTHGFGLRQGFLEYHASTAYDASDFFQIEFKKANVAGEILVAAGPIYSRYCGDVALDASGKSVSQSAAAWNLPKGPFTEWMNNEKVQNKTLHGITVPCTHDSGAYRLGPRLYHDSKSSDLPDALATAFAIGKSLNLPVVDLLEALIKSICRAQSRSIEEQLNDGIRGIDLRVVTINGGLNTGHGMIGEPIAYILQKLRQFLEQTRRELVVLMVGTGSTTNTDAEKRLSALIRDTFGDRLVPEIIDLKATKIADITAGKSRVLVTGPGFRSAEDIGYKGTEWWVQTDDPAVLVKENVARVKSHQASWANPSWTLTPQINALLDRAKEIALDIINHLFDRHRIEEDMKKLIVVFQKIEASSILNLSRKVNPLLKDVVENDLANDMINAIWVDFYEESPVVEVSIARSSR